MSDAWVRFAATGDPNDPSVPTWPSYTAAADEYLEFGAPPHVASRWRTEQLNFLERYYGYRAPTEPAIDHTAQNQIR
jgi:carboxylesterase type B